MTREIAPQERVSRDSRTCACRWQSETGGGARVSDLDGSMDWNTLADCAFELRARDF